LAFYLYKHWGLQEHGGVRGERLKKLEEFFYPLSLKDEVFKTERQFPPLYSYILIDEYIPLSNILLSIDPL
jgi:hypothetical protein